MFLELVSIIINCIFFSFHLVYCVSSVACFFKYSCRKGIMGYQYLLSFYKGWPGVTYAKGGLKMHRGSFPKHF